MSTNYEGGGYGDFGRYVLEGAFRNWKDVNPQKLSNLGVNWIFDRIGYDVEMLGEFDSNRKQHATNRHYTSDERIGKKYQWIVFYELLAKVSDNFEFKESWSDNEAEEFYQGPWNPYVRDIDPSLLIKISSEYSEFKEFWWKEDLYANWNKNNRDWIKNLNDIPNPVDWIAIDDENGKEWLCLQRYLGWEEPPLLGEERYGRQRQRLWFHIRSYLVKEEEFNELIKRLEGKSFMGKWMPESGTRYEMFDKEYYWSPASEYYRSNDYSEYGWSEIYDKNSREYIGKTMVTAVDFSWEEQYDESKESSISFLKPSEVLFDILKLAHSREDGYLIDDNGELTCFDPSSKFSTKGQLLVDRTKLLNALEENGYRLFWTVLGKKHMIGGYGQTEYLGRLDISELIFTENDQFIRKPCHSIELPRD